MRKKYRFEQARIMIRHTLPVDREDESSLFAKFDGFDLQIVFLPSQPVVLLYLTKNLKRQSTRKDRKYINTLNLKSIFGSHAINDEHYVYRVSYRLDMELSQKQFLEILSCGAKEAHGSYDLFYVEK